MYSRDEEAARPHARSRHRLPLMPLSLSPTHSLCPQDYHNGITGFPVTLPSTKLTDEVKYETFIIAYRLVSVQEISSPTIHSLVLETEIHVSSSREARCLTPQSCPSIPLLYTPSRDPCH